MKTKTNWQKVLNNDLVEINQRKKPSNATAITMLTLVIIFSVHKIMETIQETNNATNINIESKPDNNIIFEKIFNYLKFNDRQLSERSIDSLAQSGFRLVSHTNDEYYFEDNTGISLSISYEFISMFKDRIHILTLQRQNEDYAITFQNPTTE